MSRAEFQGVGVLDTILSILSIAGSCWIIKTAGKKRRKDTENRDFLVNDYVYWMSCCDLCTHIMTLLYYSSLGFHLSWLANMPDGICWLFGLLFQYSIIGGATWSFAIAVNLSRLMNGAAPYDLMPYSVDFCCLSIKKHQIVIWGWTFLLTLIPITDYGYTTNPAQQYGFAKYECWVQHTEYQMILYVAMAIYVVTTIGILFQILLIKLNILDSSNYGTIQNKLAAYSMLFSFVWLWPCINRYWALSNQTPPFFITAMHHTLLSFIGLGNYFIWSWLYPMKEPYHDEPLMKESYHDEPLMINQDQENMSLGGALHT